MITESLVARAFFHSPIGTLLLCAGRTAIKEIRFLDQDINAPSDDSEILHLCITELNQYFNGTLKNFTVPVDPSGTEFMQKVWFEVSRVTYGITCTYGDIAMKLGSVRLSRAVGLANGSNPIPIIIPCHRVIGQSGKLTGYGGGLWRKEWLLRHENRFSDKPELFL